MHKTDEGCVTFHPMVMFQVDPLRLDSYELWRNMNLQLRVPHALAVAEHSAAHSARAKGPRGVPQAEALVTRHRVTNCLLAWLEGLVNLAATQAPSARAHVEGRLQPGAASKAQREGQASGCLLEQHRQSKRLGRAVTS